MEIRVHNVSLFDLKEKSLLQRSERHFSKISLKILSLKIAKNLTF